MASSSNKNTSSPVEKYPYPTEFIVLDFVPKLSSEGKYDDWKLLMRDFIGSQGLIGFIDGTPAAKKSNEDDYMAWKRSDNLVRRWILETLREDTRLRVLSSETAKDLWTELEEIFDATRSLFHLDEDTESRQGRYLALHKAAINGDWDKAKGIIEDDPDAVTTPITPFLQTALHLAVTSASAGRNRFVRELLEKMTLEDVVDLVDDQRGTALHYAADVNNIEGAKLLVSKNPDLPDVVDHYGYTPLHWAANFRNREMVLYLKDVTGENTLLANDNRAASLLFFLTRGEIYDIALAWLKRKPEMACVEVPDYGTLFDILVEKHTSFPSGNSFNWWQSLIYSGVPVKLEGIATHHNDRGGRGDIENPANCCISVWQRLHFMIWEVAEKLVPHVKQIRKKKEIQHHALELVKFLCMEVAKSKLSEVEKIFKPALRKAACVGIPEIVEEIIVSYPLALFFLNLDHLNLFIYAIMYRRERVFNLIYQIDGSWRYIYGVDNSLNNGLHLAARLRPEQQINLKASVAGAVLQMQREVQWFKEVERFAAPGDRETRNRDGMTPAEIFSHTHQSLVKEGELWMKDTATACTIVAALIATVVFAAAITVPGGNNNDNGHPLLSKQKAFIIFGISDALALFSSITSVLMFLLILTSRYAEQDFLYTLPNRLITGLITLFVSILSTMVAFGAILYLVFGDNKPWILIPVVALASVPVTLFGALQFPLLVEMIQSTYGRGIFGKQSDRVLR
ncbi:uncharacterized protein LOC131319265 [Rhododendron vialii]|uniref:uncharacterized protein LOC131319265 n=1 Tax=Rhododendron vialii TaxID=182163 RepID=UPI00265DD29A|nr:uncharacterized protein LOC131319265 [Rhododendron vialii]